MSNFYIGRLIQTAWSPSATIIDVVMSVQIGFKTFLGVKTNTITDLKRDWVEEEGLLWVIDDGDELKACEELQSQPRVTTSEMDLGIEYVIGDCTSSSGKTYLAVKWRGYEYPTWEEEDDLLDSLDDPDIIQRYNRIQGGYRPDDAAR